MKATVVSKVTDFTICREKEQIIDKKKLKSKWPSIEPCGIPFKVFFQSLNVEPI